MKPCGPSPALAASIRLIVVAAAGKRMDPTLPGRVKNRPMLPRNDILVFVGERFVWFFTLQPHEFFQLLIRIRRPPARLRCPLFLFLENQLLLVVDEIFQPKEPPVHAPCGNQRPGHSSADYGRDEHKDCNVHTKILHKQALRRAIGGGEATLYWGEGQGRGEQKRGGVGGGGRTGDCASINDD